MKKKTIIRIFVILFLVILTVLYIFCCKMKNFSFGDGGNSNFISDENLHILPSIDDNLTANSMRCGTFQLVWNDMVNELIKQDVVFKPQLQVVENLNKQTFSNKYLSENSYFSKFGLLTLDLKAAIENGIKEKFNETSDILDQLDWSNVPQSDDYYNFLDEKEYLFYTMLRKIFNFEKAFDQLNKGLFDNKYNDIEYFGIESSSSKDLYNQVYIYYYDSEDSFAVALKTKEGEDIVLARGTQGNSFMEIFDNILKKGQKYKGEHYFTKYDYLKVPNLKFKTLTEFEDLENQQFYAANGDICNIKKALQTIEFELDKSGGYIKSEAIISVQEYGAMPGFIIEHENRYFYFDKPFVMLRKEADKDLPYFAAQISDITLFQE